MTDASRPLLAVDVDGVVSLFELDESAPPEETRFELVDGVTHCIARPTGARLRKLAEHFELVWASGWEHRTKRLAEVLDLPELPYLTFEGKARFGSADWKIGPLEAYAAGRALAWIDDSFDPSCYEWAGSREEPTLLIATEPSVGLDEVHVAALVGWSRSL